MAAADKAVPLGGHICLFQPGAGGADGFGLHVKGQHPPGGGGQPAQKGGVAAVAAGGVYAQLRVHQPCG